MMLLFAFAFAVSASEAASVTDTKAKTEVCYQIDVPSHDVIAPASDVIAYHFVADAEAPIVIKLNPYWSSIRTIRYGNKLNTGILSGYARLCNSPPLFICASLS